MMKILNNKEENIKYLKLLIKYKFDVNHKCHKDLSTLLHMACISVNDDAVKYLLEEGALAFLYENGLNRFNTVNMHSFIFGVDDSITPLCLVTELRNESTVRIASLLLNSIPDIKLIKSENLNDSGYNTDIDNLLCVALRKGDIEIISLLYEMNFDFKSFKNRVYVKCKNNEYKFFFEIESFPTVHKLKNLCRLKIRSHLGNLENCWNLYKPSNCFENECNLIPSPRRFLKNLSSLNLPITLINYLNYNLV
jgi:hypothetical protein